MRASSAGPSSRSRAGRSAITPGPTSGSWRRRTRRTPSGPPCPLPWSRRARTSAPRPRMTSSTRPTSTVPEQSAPPSLRLVGGPTALISYGGLRLLTDPTFDPPGDYPRPGTEIVLHKLTGPALPLEELGPIEAVLISHDHHSDNLDRAGR